MKNIMTFEKFSFSDPLGRRAKREEEVKKEEERLAKNARWREVNELPYFERLKTLVEELNFFKSQKAKVYDTFIVFNPDLNLSEFWVERFKDEYGVPEDRIIEKSDGGKRYIYIYSMDHKFPRVQVPRGTPRLNFN